MGQTRHNFFKFGKGKGIDVEEKQKVILINVICIIGICALIPLGILALTESNLTLGCFDLSVAVVLLAIIILLKQTGYKVVYSYFGIIIVGILII